MRRLLIATGVAALMAVAPPAGAVSSSSVALPSVASEDGVVLAQGNQAERDRRRQQRRAQRQERQQRQQRQQRRAQRQERQRQQRRAQRQERPQRQQRRAQRQERQQREQRRLQRQQRQQRNAQQQRRNPEQRRNAQQRRNAEQRRNAQQRRNAEQRRNAQQRRNAEQRRNAQQRRNAEQRRNAQQRRNAEQRRNAQQRRNAEQRRNAQQRRNAEQRRNAQQRNGERRNRNTAAERQRRQERRAAERRGNQGFRPTREARQDGRRIPPRDQRRGNQGFRPTDEARRNGRRIPSADQRRNAREDELRQRRQERRRARQNDRPGAQRDRADRRELRQLRRERRVNQERVADLRARNRRAERRADRLRDRRQELRREIRRDRRWIDRGIARRDRLRDWERRQARIARAERRAFRRDWRWFDRAERRRFRNRDIFIAGGVSLVVGASLGRLAWNAAEVDTYVLANGWNERVIVRPNGVRVVTVYDDYGIPIRRYREYPQGDRVILFNNRPGWWTDETDFIVDVPPPEVVIPYERYIVEPSVASVEDLYLTVTADPVQELDRTYTLNQVLANENLRDYMPRVDVDTIIFPLGSAEIPDDQIGTLETIGAAIEEAVLENDREVYLIEGHTDATGDDLSNLELSDRRANAVAEILTEYFEIPPENLVTQGFGEAYLKVNTLGPEAANRRVTIRRITPLLSTDEAIAGYEDETAPDSLALDSELLEDDTLRQ